MVNCPRCHGAGCSMCHDTGRFTLGAAQLWCEMMCSTVDDVTQAEKDDIATYALTEYGVDVYKKRPRTQLDDQLDALGFP